jgi:hypothetical protein
VSVNGIHDMEIVYEKYGKNAKEKFPHSFE